MKIKDLNILDIKNNKNVNTKFLAAAYEKLDLKCNIYKGDFFLDSFNYFPITKDNFTFLDLFRWKVKSEYDHFFTKKFYSNFKKGKNNYKVFNDVLVLGSSAGDNYFRNLITFLPRILFVPDKQISIAIHRKSTNKFRKFIENILINRGIKLKKFIYLDDDFYSFKNSQIPQFFSKEIGIDILNKVFKKNNERKNRIYLTRKNAYYRKIINESDLFDILKSKKFKIVDLDVLSIHEQIDVFSSAETIISPTSSTLANIVFCNAGTKIFEIIPRYKHQYEKHLKSRYSDICNFLSCEYHSLTADPIPIDVLDENTKRFIDLKIINQSSYYMNLLVNKNSFRKFVNEI